mmetsp:Transcript_31501/g.49321  ORF Transcript_31501/g.49321 Transcript_31501/m.49321 type:complete len:123 (+) Transcript_31501:1382-1750(+)
MQTANSPAHRPTEGHSAPSRMGAKADLFWKNLLCGPQHLHHSLVLAWEAREVGCQEKSAPSFPGLQLRALSTEIGFELGLWSSGLNYRCCGVNGMRRGWGGGLSHKTVGLSGRAAAPNLSTP